MIFHKQEVSNTCDVKTAPSHAAEISADNLKPRTQRAILEGIRNFTWRTIDDSTAGFNRRDREHMTPEQEIQYAIRWCVQLQLRRVGRRRIWRIGNRSTASQKRRVSF